MIRWSKKEILNKWCYSLTIECDVTIFELFRILNDKSLAGYGALLIAADGDTTTLVGVLREQLNKLKINYNFIDETLIWISENQLERLFLETDFGGSADCCVFMKNKPLHVANLMQSKRKGKISKASETKRYLNFIEKDCGQDDFLVSNIENPDLIVQSKNPKLIDELLQKLNLSQNQN